MPWLLRVPCPIRLPEHTSIAPPPAIASRTHQSPDIRFLFLPLAQQLRPVAKAWIDLYVSGKKIRERGKRTAAASPSRPPDEEAGSTGGASDTEAGETKDDEKAGEQRYDSRRMSS